MDVMHEDLAPAGGQRTRGSGGFGFKERCRRGPETGELKLCWLTIGIAPPAFLEEPLSSGWGLPEGSQCAAPSDDLIQRVIDRLLFRWTGLENAKVFEVGKKR
jgi:hypothetical protein